MYQDARSTCRAIVIIITPFVFFKMSLTCRNNFVFVKNVMTFKTCPLVRIGPYSNNYNEFLLYRNKQPFYFKEVFLTDFSFNIELIFNFRLKSLNSE